MTVTGIAVGRRLVTYMHDYSYTDSWSSRDEMYRVNNLFNKGIDTTSFYNAIEKSLPPVFTRRKASEAIGGLIAPRTFANLDAKGVGPMKIHLGSKVGYEKESFMRWLKQHIKSW